MKSKWQELAEANALPKDVEMCPACYGEGGDCLVCGGAGGVRTMFLQITVGDEPRWWQFWKRQVNAKVINERR